MPALYKLYSDWREQNLGGRDEKSVFEWLSSNIAKYRDAEIDILFSSDPLCIAVVTPLMKRAHNLAVSGDVCYVDSTASCDADGSTVTFLMAKTDVGGLPLGVILSDYQTAESYEKGKIYIFLFLSNDWLN